MGGEGEPQRDFFLFSSFFFPFPFRLFLPHHHKEEKRKHSPLVPRLFFPLFFHTRTTRHAARRNMLMKYASVSPDGAYHPPPPSNAKASYATMVFVRATIVEEAGWVLARSATIATRYAAVRRQTAPTAGEREWQVLDYQNTAHDLLPLVAVSLLSFFSFFFFLFPDEGVEREELTFFTLPSDKNPKP